MGGLILKKKTLAIIGDELGKIQSYTQQLKSLFRDNIIIKKIHYTHSAEITDEDLDFDVGLICAAFLMPIFSSLLNTDSHLIMFKRTISKFCYDELKKIPYGKNIGILSSDDEMDSVLITKLYTTGLVHLNFLPYKKMRDKGLFDYVAIFDDEINRNNYSEINQQLIFVGHSMLDITTIVDIAAKVNLEEMIFNQDIESSYNGFISTDFGLSNILDKAKLSDSYMDILLKVVNKGVIGIDNSGLIRICSKEAKRILKITTASVLNHNAFELFPFIPFKNVMKTQETFYDLIETYNDVNIIISVSPVYHSGKIYGALATVKKYTDSENEQNKLRSKIMGKGHVAKYEFNDILGKSDEIVKCKRLAMNMSKSNSSVLITGESGTGKELFAQSIHNSSNRKNAPFVALNCGAFPDNLLESELFGYEEGAFTGAKKGGKHGLLELAHTGTLFLDEIAEMPMSLQLKLLRVIQEREFMRIGSDSIIKIDVRIIAATNKNLIDMVDKGNFREDLYYRINVLPLRIPPLRNRKDDVEVLFNYMKNNFDGDFKLTDEAKEKIKAYHWKGNVRELQNIVEYLCNMKFDIVDYDDIPIEPDLKIYLNQQNQVTTENSINSADSASTESIDTELLDNLYSFGSIDKYLFVLSELEDTFNNVGRGRRKIYKKAIDEHFYMSENEIRKILSDLESIDLICIGKGRSGCHINKKGLETLNTIKIIKAK